MEEKGWIEMCTLLLNDLKLQKTACNINKYDTKIYINYGL